MKPRVTTIVSTPRIDGARSRFNSSSLITEKFFIFYKRPTPLLTLWNIYKINNVNSIIYYAQRTEPADQPINIRKTVTNFAREKEARKKKKVSRGYTAHRREST